MIRIHLSRRNVLSSVSFCIRILLVSFAVLIWTQRAYSALNIPITVKETSSVGATEYPTTVVVPLPYGAYQNTTTFRVVDDQGANIPAQFEVLNRWWAKDNSIRHIAIHFQPTVAPFTGPQTGISHYYLRDDGPFQFNTRLAVHEDPSKITVNTGPLKFTVNKANFTIFDEVWLDTNNDGVFSSTEKIISPNNHHGGVFTGRLPGDLQYDSDRQNLKIEIEENGPMRTVIRVEAVTIYQPAPGHTPGDPQQNGYTHTHGWAVRIYAYAGKPFVKVDYQLQNSAKNVVFSWPLYFESLNLDFHLNVNGEPTVKIGKGNGNVFERNRGNGVYLAQEFHDDYGIYDAITKNKISSGTIADGFIDISDNQKGVMVTTRFFWQMWPNGLKIDNQDKLSIELFPEWSAQWYRDPLSANSLQQLSPTGLYWLEDMQHTYKEVLFYFHDTTVSNQALVNLAKTFNFYPVGTLPVTWYRDTRVTLEMDGIIPIDARSTTQDNRTLTYGSKAYDIGEWYNFNWDNFYIYDMTRKWGVDHHGGGFPSLSNFIATENPADYYAAEVRAMAELNVRPIWIAQYTHDNDFTFLQLSANPYAGLSWRNNPGRGILPLDAPYLTGTGQDAKPYDDQHARTYQIEETYYYTANPWIKDFYKFLGEFRKVHLGRLDRWPDTSYKGEGYKMINVMEAFRVTGDFVLLDLAKQYFRQYLIPEQIANSTGVSKEAGNTGSVPMGMIGRAIMMFLREIDEDTQSYGEVLNFLAGLMDWNYQFGNFPYHHEPFGQDPPASSAGVGRMLMDTQAWYYWHTGQQKYFNHLNQYIFAGIPSGVGARPGGPITKGNPPVLDLTWNGEPIGRYTKYIYKTTRSDTTPPPTIGDVTAITNGTDVVVQWTAPQDAVRYHIVYSDKPISSTYTLDNTYRNWWATHIVGTNLTPLPGQTQQFSFKPAVTPCYVAIFTFDTSNNMSDMSNVALAQSGGLRDLVIMKAGNGDGTVTSTPPGIHCGSNCSASFTHGTQVTLSATADPGSGFTGWSGACTDINPTCQVLMDQAKNVTAMFMLMDSDGDGIPDATDNCPNTPSKIGTLTEVALKAPDRIRSIHPTHWCY